MLPSLEVDFWPLFSLSGSRHPKRMAVLAQKAVLSLWHHVLALPNLLGHHLENSFFKPNPLISQSQVAAEIEDGPLRVPP